MQTDSNSNTVPPWWTFGHVWLLIAGPAAVVVAGFVTLYLAISRPDPVVDADYDRKGSAIKQTLEAGTLALTPAQQARNHAATGQVPAPKPADAP